MSFLNSKRSIYLIILFLTSLVAHAIWILVVPEHHRSKYTRNSLFVPIKLELTSNMVQSKPIELGKDFALKKKSIDVQKNDLPSALKNRKKRILKSSSPLMPLKVNDSTLGKGKQRILPPHRKSSDSKFIVEKKVLGAGLSQLGDVNHLDLKVSVHLDFFGKVVDVMLPKEICCELSEQLVHWFKNQRYQPAYDLAQKVSVESKVLERLRLSF